MAVNELKLLIKSGINRFFVKISNIYRFENKINEQKELNLNKINQNIEAILEKCSTNGISKEEIASTGLRILKHSIYGSKMKKYLAFLLKILIFSIILFFAKNIESLNRLTAMYGRLLLFGVQPFWDWNEWYYSSCLINNPYYVSKPLRERDCYVCEDMFEIERRDRIKSEIISEKYIRNQIPVIIGSDIMKIELKDWLIADQEFNLDDLENIYDQNDWKNVCMFRTNIQTNDHLSLLRKVNTNHYSQIGWYAHWENCEKKTEKQMRRYYSRPNILPPMLELSKSNWILLSNNFIGLKFKQIDPSPGTQVLLMTQIKGQNRIRLKPKEYCASRGCPTIEQTLNSNEMLITSAKLWNLSYLPNSSALNLAIIVGAIYD